jgi:D-cysteine desulfhydrase
MPKCDLIITNLSNNVPGKELTMDDYPAILPERIRLANLPTPIYRLDQLSKGLGGPQIYVKRDDLTGIEFSGNKIRKLEFTAAQALAEGKTILITCGGMQSNHARATAAVAARLGLKTHLVLYGSVDNLPVGNFLLDQLFGARITLLPEGSRQSMDEQMQVIAQEYIDHGENPMVIPLGASDATGCWGYIHAVGEMVDQFNSLGWQPDAIVIPTGSGGTQAGLILGKEIFGLKCQIIGICASENSTYFQEIITRIIQEFNNQYHRQFKISPGNIKVLDDYVGEGYGLADRPLLDFISDLARLEAILVDPVYTGKALFGLVNEIKKGQFSRNSRILFIHTGGIFGLFPYAPQFSAAITG